MGKVPGQWRSEPQRAAVPGQGRTRAQEGLECRPAMEVLRLFPARSPKVTQGKEIRPWKLPAGPSSDLGV